MTRKKKVHTLEDNKNYGITNKINTQDYIMMHKAEVNSIITNTNILNFKSEISEKIGTFILGFAATIYFVPDTQIYIPIIFLFIGAALTISSVVSKKEKNKLIQKLFDEKLLQSQEN